MSNLKYRLLVIAALVAASLWALFPRTVVERVKRDGVFVSDTVRRVPLKRGLDLQGGMYLALEIDQSKGAVQNPSEALDRAIRVVRNRVDEMGVSEPIIQKAGDDRIIVELPGVDDPARAQAQVQTAAFLQFQVTDKTNALERSLPRLDALAARVLPAVAAATPAAAGPRPADGLDKRLLTPGAASPDSARPDSARRDTTRRDSAGRDPARAVASADSSPRADSAARGRSGAFSKAIQPGNIPGQYYVTDADYQRLKALVDSVVPAEGALPPGKVMRWGADTIADPARGLVYRPLYVLDSRELMTGEYLTNARPQADPIEGNKVEFTFNREGGRRFQNETARHIKDHMAVVLDQRVITAPQIQSAIGTNGQITLGGGSLQDAQDLALVLRAGALPVKLRVAETREVGASLGADSIRNGMLALGIAVALIVAVMLVYYKLSGAFAVGALLLYILLTLAMLAGFNAALTLPGLAGLVLSVGIAVDGNVLVFERIREELDRGKPVRTAVDEGFRHALSAIVDTSVTTALTAVVLYQYGTGPVRGFAVTLLVGIVASFFTVLFVTRTFYMAWLASPARAQRPLSI